MDVTINEQIAIAKRISEIHDELFRVCIKHNVRGEELKEIVSALFDNSSTSVPMTPKEEIPQRCTGDTVLCAALKVNWNPCVESDTNPNRIGAVHFLRRLFEISLRDANDVAKGKAYISFPYGEKDVNDFLRDCGGVDSLEKYGYYLYIDEDVFFYNEDLEREVKVKFKAYEGTSHD